MRRRGLIDILLWRFGNTAEILRDCHHYNRYVVPQQLAELVCQAHGNDAIRTMWDIHVSPAMREALCAPLTAEQLASIRAAEEGAFIRSVSCYVLSHKHKGSELFGVVQVSVTVRSRYSKSERAYPPTKLRIVVSRCGSQFSNQRWEVISVEQIP